MDFPAFHLHYFGDRILIALVAALHVIVNHTMAVGGIPLVLAMEWWAVRQDDERWDALAKRLMKVFFIVTTTVGALTGVGIWFAIALVNPEAIGSLLRVFFWTWFAEWIVFVTEISLVLAYYLSWPAWHSPRRQAHLRLGGALAVFSWITMMLIVAILSFMMTPSQWNADHTWWSAMFNEIYVKQLAFRTALAMVMAGSCGLVLLRWFTAPDSPMRGPALRFAALWTLAWSPFCLAALLWYWHSVPASMIENLPYALGTTAYAPSSGAILIGLGILGAIAFLIVAVTAAAPRIVPGAAILVPFLALVVLISAFERSREFVRKPYVIGNYMYANRFRVEDYPLLTHAGILPYSTYAAVHTVTPANRLLAGHEVFTIACATCHTVNGVNGIVGRLQTMYRDVPWSPEILRAAIDTLHNTHSFMPPFPGNAAEEDALAAYLSSLQPGSAAPPAATVAAPAAAPTAPNGAPLSLRSGELARPAPGSAEAPTTAGIPAGPGLHG
jgi:cytochrome bd-type quinol oxidase subunit 1